MGEQAVQGAPARALRLVILLGMVPMNRRGAAAYGIFNAGFGLFWFLGSAFMGILYDISISSLILFSVLIQLASIPLLLLVKKEWK